MHRQKEIPLINQPYIYIGETNSSHINGVSYKVIETGYHLDFHGKQHFYIWTTNEESPNTKDIDYASWLSVDYFSKNFWRA